eukprot:4069243-Pleurochrysis_carterae.AAC.2
MRLKTRHPQHVDLYLTLWQRGFTCPRPASAPPPLRVGAGRANGSLAYAVHEPVTIDAEILSDDCQKTICCVSLRCDWVS